MWVWYQLEGEMWSDINQQQDGGVVRAEFRRIVRGYSGAPGYVNNPDVQGLKGRGPIPRGSWRIGAPEEVCGGYALRLTGITREEPHRGGFLIHGDATLETQDASQGCIIIPRRFRKLIWESGDHLLQVLRSRVPAGG